jgi:hypothetical protein
VERPDRQQRSCDQGDKGRDERPSIARYVTRAQQHDEPDDAAEEENPAKQYGHCDRRQSRQHDRGGAKEQKDDTFGREEHARTRTRFLYLLADGRNFAHDLQPASGRRTR